MMEAAKGETRIDHSTVLLWRLEMSLGKKIKRFTEDLTPLIKVCKILLLHDIIMCYWKIKTYKQKTQHL